MSLRDLAAAATAGPWRVDPRFPRAVYGKIRVVATAEKVGRGRADARLIAMAPDLALLLADTMDTIEPLAHPGSEWQVLLARFRDLERRATE